MYCTKCGNKLEDNQKYCTSCGYNRDNNINTNNINDEPNIGLNIVGFLWPLVGLIIYLCTKDTTPKRAAKVGKWSLISFIIKTVLSIICFILFLTFIAYMDAKETATQNYEYYDSDTFEEDNHTFDKTNKELDDFIDAIDYYNLLATKQFYEDAYTNKELTDVCYDIKELEKNNQYMGSIQVKMENNELKSYIWLTDSEYVINGIEYDNYEYKDIKKGDKITNSCKPNNTENSL